MVFASLQNRSKIQEASERSGNGSLGSGPKCVFLDTQQPCLFQLRQGAKIWSQTDVVQILVRPIIGVTLPRVSRTGNRLLVCSVPPLLSNMSSTVGHLNCRPASLC